MNRLLIVVSIAILVGLMPSKPRAGSEYDDISELRLPVPDPRLAVAYSREDRSYILGQMRLFLATTQRIMAAAGDGDGARIAELAAVLGANHNRNDPSRPAGIRERQPKPWDQTVVAMRNQFDALAAQAAAQPVSASLQQMSIIMQACTGCHQTYRITELEKR